MNPKTIIHKSPTQTVYSDGTSERSPNSEYLTDEEYYRMKQDVESRENLIADASKKVSPLDEYLVNGGPGVMVSGPYIPRQGSTGKNESGNGGYIRWKSSIFSASFLYPFGSSPHESMTPKK